MQLHFFMQPFSDEAEASFEAHPIIYASSIKYKPKQLDIHNKDWN